MSYGRHKSARFVSGRIAAAILPLGAAALTFLAGASGFVMSGFRSWGFATDLELRVAMVFFVIALATRPVLRVSPTIDGAVRRAGSRAAWLCFSASYGTFLLSVVLPSPLVLSGTIPKIGLVLLNAPILTVLTISAAYGSPLWSRTRIAATLFFLSVSYFWIVFAFAAVAGLSTPVGTDIFSAVLLILLVLLLPVRVVDSMTPEPGTSAPAKTRLAEKVG